ncbi:CPCC family cysteine-rich protein [Longimicrobium sp.]|jgi:hypothetical protein|uniref:CPCC family cysteine-rich protein n=1 Tax=Longimicrobium sp. TaxID=2029185 RepID=UPI002F94BFDD
MTADARFSVGGAFYIPERGCVIVHGSIVSGQLAPGMIVATGPPRGARFQEPIHAIGSVRPRADDPEEVALVFPCLHPHSGVWWPPLFAPGQVLLIPVDPVLYPCHCCGFHTLSEAERGTYEICRVCGWEDDGAQSDDPDYRGGANTESLNEARAAFRAAHPHLFPSPDA